MKKVLIQFSFPTGNKMQYDNVWKDLRAAGHGNPKGLIYHVGAEQTGGGLSVVDVWESEQAFKDFGNVLMPILEKNDIAAVPPQILPIYNIYEKQKQPLSM
jgi:hypothetical protein